MKNTHLIWMVIGCALPFLIIFLAPAFGLGSSWSLFFFVVAMFAMHLFMPHGSHGHSGHTSHNHKTADDNAKETPSGPSPD
ncbi:hypothetical protein DTW91_01710 [Chryseobacterium sp. SC28]|nr:hypothetical protein DTW91_01710 [Chryseobacterium sp. SC28]